MGIEYRGSEFLYIVEIPPVGVGTATEHRFFNQTEGSTTVENDDIELSTKDKSGSDYGDSRQNISLSGLLTEGDPAIDYIKTASRQKEFVSITEVNTRTNEAEKGLYKINSFTRNFANGDFADYSIDASLNGNVTPVTLTTVPEGAPESTV